MESELSSSSRAGGCPTLGCEMDLSVVALDGPDRAAGSLGPKVENLASLEG